MRKTLVYLTLATFLTAGCAPSIPKDALQLKPDSLANRQMQTRRFETASNDTMLSAAAAVFQDLGFTLEESEYSLGVIVGSKERDATSAGQIAGALVVAALFGVQTHVDNNQVIKASMVMREIVAQDDKAAAQSKLTPEILVSIKNDVTNAVAKRLRERFPDEVSKKVAEKIAADTAKTLTSDLARLAQTKGSGESTVRVTFQRIIYNTAGQATTLEQINEPVLYQEFFDKLSQAVFLEAHEI